MKISRLGSGLWAVMALMTVAQADQEQVFPRWRALASITPKFAAFADDASAASPPAVAGWQFFLEPGDYGATARTTSAGLGYRVGEDILLGAAFDLTSSLTPATVPGLDGERLGLALFGNYARAPFYLDSSVGFARNVYPAALDQDLENFADSRTAGSGHDEAEQFFWGVGMGYKIAKGPLAITPSLRLDYAAFDLAAPGVTATVASEATDSADLTSLTSSLGGQVAYAVDQSWGVLVPHLRFEWVHEFSPDTGLYKGRLAGSEQPAYTYSLAETTTPLDDDYFNLGVGLSARFSGNSAAFLSYEKVFGKSDLSDYTVRGGIRFEF